MQPFLRTSTLGTALDVVPHRCRPAGNGDGRPAHAVLNKVVLPQLAAGLPNGCARRVKGSQTGADRLVPKSCWPPLAAGLSTTTAGTTATALSASLRGDRRRSLPAASNRAAAAPAERSQGVCRCRRFLRVLGLCDGFELRYARLFALLKLSDHVLAAC